jgi:PAS domain S-box-containing protein
MIRVLLVDDEPSLLDITKDFLIEIGDFQVEEATSVEIALDKMKHESFDVIVSDYQMPDISGIDFLKILRHRNDDIPFILFTGRGREEVVIDAINSGADYYLQKGGEVRAQFSELAHQIIIAHQGRSALDTLKKRNEEVEFFFDLSLDLLFIANTDGFFIELNPQWEAVLGYTLAELKETPFISFIHPDDIKASKTAMDELISQKPLINYINRYRCKDGSYRYLEWRSRSNGKMIYGSAEDITERRNEESRIRHLNGVLRAIRNVNQLLVKEKNSDRLLDAMCENLVSTRGFSSSWILIYGLNGSIESIHGAGTSFNKKEYKDDISKGFVPPCATRATQKDSLVVSERGAGYCVDCKFADSENNGTAITMPLRYGQRSFGVITVSLPKDQFPISEEMSLFEEIVGDISFGLNSIEKEMNSKDAQRSLLENEKMFSTIFHKSFMAMAITRMSDGQYIDVNDSFLKLTERTRKQTIGKTVTELQFYENISDRRIIVEEFRRDGNIRERKVPIRTDSGKIISVITSIDPVTYKGEKCMYSTIRVA